MENLDCIEKTQVIAVIYVAEDTRGPGNSSQHGNVNNSAVPWDLVPVVPAALTAVV